MTLIGVGLENLHLIELRLHRFHDVDLIDFVELADKFEYLWGEAAHFDIDIHLFVDDFLVDERLFNQGRSTGLSFFVLSQHRGKIDILEFQAELGSRAHVPLSLVGFDLLGFHSLEFLPVQDLDLFELAAFHFEIAFALQRTLTCKPFMFNIA